MSDFIPLDDREAAIDRVLEAAHREVKKHPTEGLAGFIVLVKGYAPDQFGFDACGEPRHVMAAVIKYLLLQIATHPDMARLLDLTLGELDVEIEASIDGGQFQ